MAVVATQQPTGALAEPPIRPLTVDEVIRMAEAGIITEGERVELIDGQLVVMSPEGLAHLGLIGVINTLLTDPYRPPIRVYPQSTLRFDDLNYRLPDFAVTDAPLFERAARADEVILLVEVADSSLRYDLGSKARGYASWGAAHLWVVDVSNRRLVVHTEPGPDGYGRVTTLASGQNVTLPRAGASIAVSDLLPPA